MGVQGGQAMDVEFGVLILVCVEVSVGEINFFMMEKINTVLILVCVEVSVGVQASLTWLLIQSKGLNPCLCGS